MIEKRKADSIQMKMIVESMKMMAKQSGIVIGGNGGTIDVGKIRSTMEGGYSRYPMADNVSVSSVDICPVHMEKLSPADKKEDNIVLYIHGGGFCCGSAKLSRGIGSHMAKDLSCDIYTVDYALAPEKKLPAGLDDCYTAYKALAKEFPDKKIAVMGESAGATASLVVELHCLADKIKVPCCLVVHSPLGTMGDIQRDEKDTEDIMIAKDGIKAMEGIIFNKKDAYNPFISPLYGNFKNGCPVYMTCDEKETLSTDAVLLYKKLEADGCQVDLIMYSGAFHAFGASGRGTPETSKVLDESEDFIRKAFQAN